MADGADRRDADLVVDVRAGNAASFGLLFERWFGPVLGAAEALVGSRAEAARVATDTFQSVWLHLDELGDPEGFGAWVLLTSRTFARQRQTERDPSAGVPSGPPFDNDDELRWAVAKVLVRRQVPALGQPVPAPSAVPPPGPGVPSPPSAVGAGPGPVAALSEPATDRLHRYHWAPAEPASGVRERILSFRLSPGTLVALAIVLLGSVIWLMSRDGSSQIDGGRPAPLFSPAAPTTIDGAAARSGNGAAAPGGSGVAPGSLLPDPATPATEAPGESAAPAGSRKVKVAAVVPRSVATTPVRRGTTAAAPGPAAPVATVAPATTPAAAPRTDGQPSTTVTAVSPPSATSTGSTAGSTTEPTTSSTARTTTTTEPTTATSRVTTTRDGTTSTSTRVTTTTTRVTIAPTIGMTTPTTRATTVTTAASTTSRPSSSSALAPATPAPPLAVGPLT